MSRLISHIIMLAAAFGLVQCSSGRESSSVDFPDGSVQEGDIAFRRGQGITSNLVAYNDAEGKYSHVGVVVRQGGDLMVVHAVPGEGSDGLDRVRIVSLSDFFSADKAVRGEIMRYPLDSVQRNLISDMAIKKARQKIRFDHQYDLGDTTKLYCSELLQLIFKNAGVDLAQGRSTRINVPTMSGDYIMPSDIHRNPLLRSTYLF